MAFYIFAQTKDPGSIIEHILADISTILYQQGVSNNPMYITSGSGAPMVRGNVIKVSKGRFNIEIDCEFPINTDQAITDSTFQLIMNKYNLYLDDSIINIKALAPGVLFFGFRSRSDTMGWAGDLLIKIITPYVVGASQTFNGIFLGLDSTTIVLGLDANTLLDITL